MPQKDRPSSDTQETGSYESPKITDLSDGTNPLAAAPGTNGGHIPIPSGALSDVRLKDDIRSLLG